MTGTGIECALVGALGRDPDYKRVRGGELALLEMTVNVRGALNSGSTPGWVRVVAFEDLATEWAPWLAKGDLVSVTGRLSLNEWVNRDGVVQHSLHVVARRIDVQPAAVQRRPADAHAPRKPRKSRRKREEPAQLASGELDDDISDLGAGQAADAIPV